MENNNLNFPTIFQISNQILKYNILVSDFMPCIDNIPIILHKMSFLLRFFSLHLVVYLSLSLAHGSWLCAVRLICPVWLCMLNAVLNCPAPSAHTPSCTHNSHPSRPRARPPSHPLKLHHTHPKQTLLWALYSSVQRAIQKERVCFIPRSCFDSLFEKISLVLFKNRR